MGNTDNESKANEGGALEPVRPIEQDTVTLFGHPVRAVRLPDGRVAASFGDMTQALGLVRNSQARRVRADEAISDQLLPTVLYEADGSELPGDVLTAWAIPMWLTGLQVARLAPERRPTILAFKREAADVLYRHFSQPHTILPVVESMAVVEASVPAVVASADMHQVAVLAEQIDELTGVVNLLREHLVSLVDLPGQVEGLSQQMDEALALLGQFADRQQMIEGQVAQIDERTQRLTPAHARAVKEMVDRMERETRRLPIPLTYYIVYGRLKKRFQVASYNEIADERYEEVMTYLRDELRRATSGEAPEQGSLF